MPTLTSKIRRPVRTLAALLALCVLVVCLLLRAQSPAVQNGQLDLEDVDLEKGGSAFLSGEWEYFSGKLLVTEMLSDANPDRLVTVPSCETGDPRKGIQWGSYRLHLLNCPPETVLSVSLRGLPSAYRIFLNGQLVESGGVVSKEDAVTVVQAEATQSNAVILRSSTSELVVEMAGRYLPGMSLTPMLMGDNTFDARHSWQQAWVLILFGMAILMVGYYAMNLVLTPRSGYSPQMLAALLLLLCKLMSLNAVYGLLLGGGSGYDLVVLLAGWAQLAAWGILLGLDYGENRVRPSRRVLLLTVVLPLTACFCAPVLGWRFGFSAWRAVGDAVVLCLLGWRLLWREKPGHTLALLPEGGYLFLWLGCTLADLALSGLLPKTYDVFACIGVAAFALSVSYADQKRMNGIQQESLRAVQMEAQLQRAKTEIALHQIKPHFLHNALMSIKVLCRVDPKRAETAVCDFSVFLRNNMNSIGAAEPIPFSEEVRSIEGYLHLEQIRFGARLQVKQDLRATAFSVPALTIQPLVENAVCHGICPKPAGGTVKISSWAEETRFVVEITDDGVGFDTAMLNGSSGIGIRNLRLRLKEQMGATLEIVSEPGMGTTQRVYLPKGGTT